MRAAKTLVSLPPKPPLLDHVRRTKISHAGSCADPESFFQRGSNFDYVFLNDGGREYPNATISGTSLARQRNATYMAFRWQADGGPALNAGLVAL